MKKYALFLCTMTLATMGYSQIRFGVKGGLLTSSLNQENLAILDAGGVTRLKLALEDANYGVNFGFLIRAEIGDGFLQPEVNFRSNSVNFTLDDLGQPGTPGDILKESYQYFDIPVMVGFRLGPLRLQGGPQGNFFLNSSSDLFDFQDYDQNFKDFTVGYVVGGGLDIWNLMIDLRYQGNFSKFGEHITFFGKQYQFDQSPAQFNLTVGWLFGGRK
jgi:hypothetical protein